MNRWMYGLAMELAVLGVRLQPDFVNARFNYGVALAREQRYAEAAQQFQEVLRRQPDHAAAKSALARALQLEKSSRP